MKHNEQVTNNIIKTIKNYYKMIAIDLSKQQALDVDPTEI